MSELKAMRLHLATANDHHAQVIPVMHLAYPECDEIPIPLPVSRIDDKSEKVDGRRTLI